MNQPNIIKSVDMFIDHSHEEVTQNLLLQLVEGKVLSKVEKGTLSGPQAFDAINQFYEAIRHAFSLKLLHLDLHDGNIMMTNNHEIMVVDLASFFTLDEFMDFIDEMKAQPINTARQDDLKDKKMKQFLQRLKEIQKKPSENNRLASLFDYDRDTISLTYYSMIIDVCKRILSKSTLDENEKLLLQGELDALNSTLLADHEAGNEISSEDFFEKLLSIFEPIQSIR